MVDFRDLVVLPGRYLWSYGNPYDVGEYLAANSQAQEFPAYAPAWLTVFSPIGLLPYPVAVTVWLFLMVIVAAGLCYGLVRWAQPQWPWLAPVLFGWGQVWYPLRSVQESGASLLAVAGVALAVVAAMNDRWRWCAVGVAVAMLKLQFGLPLLVLLVAYRAWRSVAAGLTLIGIASLPTVFACAAAAGGFTGWLSTVLGGITHSSSPDAPTGLLSPFSQRVDLVGLAVRLGAPVPSTIVELSVTALMLGLGYWMVRRKPDSLPVVAGTVPLLVLVHMPYDGTLLLLAGVWALRSWAAAVWAPILHVHRCTSWVGLSDLAAQTVDVIIIAVVIILTVLTSSSAGEQRFRKG